MKILVLNCGSSSVKYELCDIEKEVSLAEGEIESIGSEGIFLEHRQGRGLANKTKLPIVAKDHVDAINEILKILVSSNSQLISDKNEILAVGHRFVHGGEYFTEPVVLSDEIEKKLEKCIELAPLHNPHHIKGILAINELLPDVPQVIVFDTAFHKTIPEYAYLYPLPYRFYKQYKIRKYGFHGISHQYLTERLSQIVKIPIEKIKAITCHLGNGASVTAIKDGVSVDTSMGFTPLEGLMMGTRCGNIDAAIPLHLMSLEETKVSDMQAILNKQSGLLGVSGISSDMRTVLKKADDGNERAQLAIEMFCYRIKKYISSYLAVISGCGYIVFSAAIGERSALIRKKILSDMESLGIIVDDEKNSKCYSTEMEISDTKSTIKVFVIPTNEAIVIARETKKLLDNKPKNK